MNILVINSGSSSIKYQLFQMPEKKVICKGMVERIGIENGKIIAAAQEEGFTYIRIKAINFLSKRQNFA